MVKKQRTFWMNEREWKILQNKIGEQGLHGKGKLERFMEKVCNQTIIFIQGDCILEIKEK